MLNFIARFVMSLVIYCLTLFIVVEQSGEANSAALFLVPMIGLIPGFVMALLFFVPIEKLAAWARIDWGANILVPLAGMAGSIITMALLAAYFDDAEIWLRNHERAPEATYMWIGFGMLWGMVWRFAGLIDGLIHRGGFRRAARQG